MQRRCLFLLMAATLAGLLTAPGCSQKRKAKISKTMASWVGHHQSELLASWGAPSREASDGKGGKILVYEYDRSRRTTGRVDAYGNFSAQDHSYVARREFFVAKDGKIYRWKWQGW